MEMRDKLSSSRHKYLVRRKDSPASPLRKKLERKINYIEYSPTRKSINSSSPEARSPNAATQLK